MGSSPMSMDFTKNKIDGFNPSICFWRRTKDTLLLKPLQLLDFNSHDSFLLQNLSSFKYVNMVDLTVFLSHLTYQAKISSALLYYFYIFNTLIVLFNTQNQISIVQFLQAFQIMSIKLYLSLGDLHDF